MGGGGGGSSMAPVIKSNDSAENKMDNNKKINVYVWDMDETLILLKSLLNGTYAQSFNGSKDAQKGLEIGKMWEKHILQLCDDYFFYEQVSLLFIAHYSFITSNRQLHKKKLFCSSLVLLAVYFDLVVVVVVVDDADWKL